MMSLKIKLELACDDKKKSITFLKKKKNEAKKVYR